MARRKKFPDHLHKYKRIKLGNGYKVYKCINPGCSHYVSVKLVEGQICQCNRCGQPMVMDRAAMQLARPHCYSCTKSRRQETIEKIAEFLEG
jgi:formylmethanofuran dehydrogenase subunit E